MPYDVTVIIPVYNSEKTLRKTLSNLEKQNYPISQVFLVDNQSKDSSHSIMEEYKQNSRHSVVNIYHEKDLGLSFSYNECIRLAQTDLIITLHSDIVICDEDGIEKLVKPFKESKDVVGTYSHVKWCLTENESYSFWEKSFLSRHLNKLCPGRNGMFNCFKRLALLNIGLFDEKTFRTAGEDGDLYIRLQKEGSIVSVNTIVEHLLYSGKNFGVKRYIYKESQYAEAGGACLRKNFKEVPLKDLIFINARFVLVLGLLIRSLRLFFVPLVLIYSIFITKNMFILDRKNPRVLILPFVNIYILFRYSFFYLKGFLTGKQRL